MVDIDAPGTQTALVPRSHRVVRALDRHEGPFAGTLVTREDGMAVQVDAAQLAGWSGWRYAGKEHVAAPEDLVRRADGHDALLPWCTDAVPGFVVRRGADGSPLSAGECSTLVISMLRGLDEIGAERENGSWWLTDRGRPVLVIGEGGDARAGAADIVGQLVEDSDDKALKRALSAVREGLRGTLSQPRVPRPLLENWELELMAVAAPQPIVIPADAAESAHAAVRTHPAPAAVSARDTRRVARASSSAPSEVTRIARVRSAASGCAAQLTEMLRRRFDRRGAGARRRRTRRSARSDATTPTMSDGRPAPRRRRTLLVAGGAAAAVLVGGLLWPGSVSEAGADRGVQQGMEAGAAEAGADGEGSGSGGGEPGVEGTAVPSPTPGPKAPAGSDADSLEAVAASLVGAVEKCRASGDAACADAVATGSTGVLQALDASGDASRQFAIVDEYGDVAVIRVTMAAGRGSGEGQAASAPEQMLVLVRQDEKWLVRDVYSVADQPG